MAARTNNPPNAAANGTPHPDGGLPKELVDAMQAIFGKHPGYRTSMYDPIYDGDNLLIFVLHQPTLKAFSWRVYSRHLRKPGRFQ